MRTRVWATGAVAVAALVGTFLATATSPVTAAPVAAAPADAAPVFPSLLTNVDAARGATLTWRGVTLAIPAGALAASGRVRIAQLGPGDFRITGPTLAAPAELSLPTTGVAPMVARKVHGRFQVVASTQSGAVATVAIRTLGEYSTIDDCAPAALGRARVACALTRGVVQVPKTVATGVAGSDLTSPGACAAARASTPTVDLFRWAAVCSPAAAIAGDTGAANASTPSDTVELVRLTDGDPAGDGGGIALHVDGSVQLVDASCVAHLTNRNVPTVALTVDQISSLPRSEQTQCAPLYGPAETACPVGTSSTGTEVPPVVCSAPGREARYISAAAGGRVDLGDFSLVVPPGVLTRDCYAQLRILDDATRYTEADTDCAYQGTVTAIVPNPEQIDPTNPLKLLHLYPDAGIVPESVMQTSDGRVSAELKNLSPVMPGPNDPASDTSTTCVDKVLQTLSVESQTLNAGANRAWARSVCGYALVARSRAVTARDSISAADYDNLDANPSRGYGPKRAAELCSLAVGITRSMRSGNQALTLAALVASSTDATTDPFLRSVNAENFAVGMQVASKGLDAGVADCVARAKGGSSTETLRIAIDGSDWSTYDYRTSTQCPCYVPPVVTPPPPIYTPPPYVPPPSPSVGVSKGQYVHNGNCSSPSCGYVVVSLYNFGGGSHRVTVCFSDGCYSYTTSANPSAVYYYGYPGRGVYAVVDGVRSGTMTWY